MIAGAQNVTLGLLHILWISRRKLPQINKHPLLIQIIHIQIGLIDRGR
jgi:hypothetical protein